MEDFLRQIRKDKQKVIAVVLGFAVFAYVDLAFVIKAQIKAVSETSSKAAKLSADILTVRRDVSLIQQNQSRDKSKPKVKKLVTEGEMLNLLENISLIARNNAIRVAQINPVKSARPPVKQGQKQSPFIPALIKLDLNCNYHSLGVFLNDLENGDYAVSAEDLKILPDSSSGQKERALLTLKTYVKG